MNWAKIIYMALIIAGWIICVIKNGEPRPDYSAGSATISLILTCGLLWAGGFFA